MIRKTRLTKKVIKQRQRELNKKAFASEKWFESELLKRGASNSFHKNKCLEGRFFGDFVWVKKKVVVEIDGSSHRGREEYDQARDAFLKKRGWKVLRISYPYTKRCLDDLFLMIQPTLDYYKKRANRVRASKKLEKLKPPRVFDNPKSVANLNQRREKKRPRKVGQSKISVIKGDPIPDTLKRALSGIQERIAAREQREKNAVLSIVDYVLKT